MKENIVILFIFFLGYQLEISSQSIHQKIIESEIVNDKLTFQVIGGKLNMSIDGNEAKEMTKELYLQGKSDQIIINTKFIHPLKYQVTLENEVLEDELTKAAQEYFNQFQSYITSISGGLTKASPSGIAITSSSTPLTIKNPHLIELYAFLNASYQDFFSSKLKPNRKPLLDAIVEIDDKALEKKIIAQYEDMFNNIWTIDNYSNIKSIIDKNKLILKEIESSIKKIKESNEKLKMEAESFAKIFITTNADALAKNTVSLINNKVDEVENDHTIFLEKKKELDSKYEAFTNLFGNISQNTYGDEIKETRINSVQFEKGKRNELTIFLKVFDYDKTSKVIKEKEQKEYKILMRRYRTFIPVVASGVLYTNLSFQTFGTETNADGETVLAQGESEDNEITIGAYLNLYLNNGWSDPIFLQFGVGPSKEKPLIFSGLGISIGSRISLSGGAVFTWVPTLDELEVGDIVTGTTQIENDIKYGFINSPKFYLGISFDLTD